MLGFDVSLTGVLIGLVHVVGLAAAAGLSFAIGVGLCAHGLVPSLKGSLNNQLPE